MEELLFTGFTQETVRFFSGLQQNNSKAWFETNREIYENHVLGKAQQFVMAIGRRLQQELSPEITAIPKIDKSIFRLHRDVRFSPDKSPYKTHLGVYFWDGPNKKLENPGYYFQLNSRELMWGVGFHLFSKSALQQWRQALDQEKLSGELNALNRQILSLNPAYTVEGKHYKNPPRGFSREHPQAEWLLYNGIAYIYREEISDKLYGPEIADFTMKVFHDFAPIQKWLKKMMQLPIER